MKQRRRYPGIIPIISAGLLIVLSAPAQAGITLDGSVGPSGTLTGPNYSISDTVGTRTGNNLFHSFGTFTVGTGESATFSGPSGIANIIGRVTGGSPSSVDGLIRSTIDNANLYLINPSGLFFGPNASLDVRGSFHASTADYIKFSNGDNFYADRLLTCVLSVAEPASFGFLNASPASITVDQSTLQVPVGQTLTLAGGGVTLTNDPAKPSYFDFDTYTQGTGYYVLSAPGGRINIASVGSPGEVSLNDADLGAASFSSLGDVVLRNGANLTVASDIFATGEAGSIFIRGRDILLKDLGVAGLAYGIDASGNPAGTVDIKGRSLQMDNVSLTANSTGEIDHGVRPAFIVDLTVEFSMYNGAQVDTSNFGPGSAGDIAIRAGSIVLGDEIPGTGPLADVGFYGYLNSSTYTQGKGGNISLTAGDILIRNGFYLVTSAMDQGNAGNISVQSDTLKCLDQGNIGSNAYALGFDLDGNPVNAGSAGKVSIVSRDILISAANSTAVVNSSQITGITSQVDGKSNGGKISVTADTLQIRDGGRINTVLNGTERGSDVEITAKNMTVSGYYIDVDGYRLSAVDGRLIGTFASGTGGDISVTTDSLTLANGGVIRTGLYNNAPGTSNAGNITVNAKNVDIATRGQIYADSFRGTGNSGNITVNAATMSITGAKNAPRPGSLDFDFTGLSTTTNAGIGGKITVVLSGDLTATNGGGIKADTQGIGSGGAIDISAANIGLSGSGTEINALSANTGNAGNIGLKAGVLTLADGSSVTTQAKGDGAGGAITVTADALALSGAGQITSSASGAGNAGKIAVTLTGDLEATSGGGISADTSGSGTGGSIAVDARNVTFADKGFLGASSSGSGHAGEIFIKSGRLQIENSGSIATSATDIGNAGKITVETGTLQMASAGQISSSSAKSGNAGNISVTATDSVYLRDSSITTEALLADGGNISIKAPNTIRLDNSTLTASVNGEKETTGGNIIIDPQYVILKGSDVIATAHKGTGGNIDITANVFIADASSVVSAASELGFPGSVNIRAPNNISGIIAPLPADYTSASALLRERCIARIREGKYSSFVVGGRDGLPMEPGNMLSGLIH
ncbi:MAG: filamentous hemagglutinin N-terminal domain-containing protein [Verrucomicrobia bacterium]|nr:filamentous hemagglutinin N-terminal domain-containing protein [Deltaproteobacteria bacterium]